MFSEKRGVELTIIGDSGSEWESLIEKQRTISALETTGSMTKTRLLGYLSYKE